MTMTDTVRLVAEVKAYALAHYNDGGWDVIVECWDDSDIADAIGGAKTLIGARRKLAAVIDVWSDRQADARIEGEHDIWYGNNESNSTDQNGVMGEAVE